MQSLCLPRDQKSAYILQVFLALTCRDKEDPCAEDDIMATAVELTGCHTEAPHEEQTHTHYGEDTGGPHGT